MNQQRAKRPLPPGWKWTRLGDVCRVVPGFGFPIHLQGRTNLPYPFFKVEDMNRPGNEETLSLASNTVDRGMLGQMRGRTYPPGTVVFPKVGGAIATNKRRRLAVEATFDNNVMGVIPGQQLTSDWLYLFLRTVDLYRMARVQALPSIRQSDVATLILPLPPVAEQQCIAARLSEQMAMVNRARKAAEAQLEAANALRPAFLRHVYESEEAKRWPTRRLGDVCSIAANQVDPTLPRYRNLPHVGGENIESGTCRLLPVHTAAEDGMLSGKYLFGAGDILYSKIRPYLRKAVLVGFDGLCSADIYPLRTVPDVVDPTWLAHLLVSDSFTEYADAESARVRMPKLNRDQLYRWETPIPPLEVQRSLADDLSGWMGHAENLRRAAECRAEATNALPGALLEEVLGGFEPPS